MKSLKEQVTHNTHSTKVQFLRFSFVGASSTAMDFGLLFVLVQFFKIHPIPAAAISYIVSLLYNYWGSMKWVFVHREDISRSKEMSLFFVLSGVGFVLNEFCMWLGKIYCQFYDLNYRTGIYYLIAKFIADIIVSIWNFYSRKRWLDASCE